jgi:hypothetical protein
MMNNVTIEISEESYRRISALRRPGESDEELLLRCALALRSSGGVSDEQKLG